MSESDLADAALKVESGAKQNLSQAEIHSSYIEPTQNEVSLDEENARKPVQSVSYCLCPGGGMADAEDLKSSGDFSSCGFDSHPGHFLSS